MRSPTGWPSDWQRTGTLTSCTPTSGCRGWPPCGPDAPGRPRGADVPRPRERQAATPGRSPTRARPSGSSWSGGSRGRRMPSSRRAATRWRSSRDMGVPTAHVHVVPCGVDTAHFSPSGPAWDHGLPRGRRARLLAVGRLVERKGFDLAVARPAGAARTPSSSSSAARRRSGSMPTPRPAASGHSPSELGVRRPASADRAAAPRGHAGPLPLAPPSCSRCRGTSRSASRPSRPRRAAAPRRQRGRRSARLRGGRRDRPPRPPARRRRPWRRRVRGLLADPDGAARMGRRAAGPSGRAVRLVRRRGAHRGGARDDCRPAVCPTGAVGWPPDGENLGRRGSTSTPRRSDGGMRSLLGQADRRSGLG